MAGLPKRTVQIVGIRHCPGGGVFTVSLTGKSPSAARSSGIQAQAPGWIIMLDFLAHPLFRDMP